MEQNNICVAFGSHTYRTNKHKLKKLKEINKLYISGELTGTEVLELFEAETDPDGLVMYMEMYYSDLHRAIKLHVDHLFKY